MPFSTNFSLNSLSSFSCSLRYEFIFLFEIFLLFKCRCLLLWTCSTAFASSHWFWYVCSFLFALNFFLISFWFSLYIGCSEVFYLIFIYLWIFWFFSFYCWLLDFFSFWLEKLHSIISIFLNLLILVTNYMIYCVEYLICTWEAWLVLLLLDWILNVCL